MEKVCADKNHRPPPLSGPEAQSLLSSILNDIAQRVAPYCWKLLGDDPDSISNLLDISSNDMLGILRLCAIVGPADSRLKLATFENFGMTFQKPFMDWQMYRPKKASGRAPFIRIGSTDLVDEDDEGISLKGSDQYGGDGTLSLLPELQKHKLSMKPRESRQKLSILLAALNSERSRTPNIPSNSSAPSTPAATSDSSPTTTPEERVVSFVVEQMRSVAVGLGKTESFKITTRTERNIKKKINTMLNDAAVCMLKKAILNLSGEKSIVTAAKSPLCEQKQKRVVTPARRSLTTDINLEDEDDADDGVDSDVAEEAFPPRLFISDTFKVCLARVSAPT